jgi:hypothetical protein
MLQVLKKSIQNHLVKRGEAFHIIDAPAEETRALHSHRNRMLKRISPGRPVESKRRKAPNKGHLCGGLG